jgi:hypothetical protein
MVTRYFGHAYDGREEVSEPTITLDSMLTRKSLFYRVELETLARQRKSIVFLLSPKRQR